MKNLIHVSLMSIVISLSTGCSVLEKKPAKEPTAEELALQKEMMMALINRMNSPRSTQKSESLTAEIPASSNHLTPAELKQKLNSIQKNGTGYQFSKDRDGIKINGKTFLDPSGKIVDSGNDPVNGDFTYITQKGAVFEIKYSNASNTQNSVAIASAKKIHSGFEVTTATGQSLSGNRIIPTSKGFIVSRETSAFQYQPETDTITSVAAPAGYHVAHFQNGDVDSTGYMLFEKDLEPNPADNGDLVGTTKKLFSLVRDAASLTGAVDATQKDGYKLIDIRSGKEVTLNIDAGDKEVSVGRNCQRKSSVHNVCDDFETFEALYKPDGFKNHGHYYWRAHWFNTPAGKFAIVQEQRLKDINIINLETGDRVNLFTRAMGISGFDALQHPDGRITVTAKLGFTTEVVEDAASAFSESRFKQQ